MPWPPPQDVSALEQEQPKKTKMRMDTLQEQNTYCKKTLQIKRKVEDITQNVLDVTRKDTSAANARNNPGTNPGEEEAIIAVTIEAIPLGEEVITTGIITEEDKAGVTTPEEEK